MAKLLSGLTALLALASGACFAPSASATTLKRMSLVELARAADTIVQVRCLATSSHWDGGAIWTFIAFDVLDSFKGARSQHIRVRVPGGRVGHLVASIESAPQFQPGEESVLFLEKNSAGDYSVTAWAEGTFRIHRPPTAAPSGVAAVTQDSSLFAVFDPATRSFRAEGVRNLPLDEFRRRITAAVAQPAAGASR